MTACNVVRFQVKPGKDQQFIAAHSNVDRDKLDGFTRGSLIKTGGRSYCYIGEWKDFSSIEKSRESMIGILDSFRDTLEDLGNGLGVTDPVSGEVVLEV